MSANLNPSTLDESLSEAAGRESEILARLKSDLKNKRLVIVVGAGVTLNATADASGRPLSRITWTGLIRNGLEYLVNNGYVEASSRRKRRAYEAFEDPNTDSLLEAANILSSQLNQHGQFSTWLETVFVNLDQEIRHPAILEALKVLHENGATLLTTNYDDLLEKYCDFRHIGRSNQDEILKFKRGDLDGVFHVHGSYHDPHEVMLDTTDYYEVRHVDEVQNILKTFLEYKTMVFIGCGSGLEDPNFDALLKWASERQKNIPNRHCLLIRDGDNLKYKPLVRLKYGPGYQNLAPYLNNLLDEAPTPADITADIPLFVQNINLGIPTTRKYQDYTVGWICALPTEMAAAVGMLDEHHNPLQQDPYDHNTYTLGRIGGHNIALACLPAGVTGTISAAKVATQMLSSFKALRFGLMVGIGGGVPSEDNDIRLGDVVVSKPTDTFGGVIQYDFGKTVQDGHFKRTGSLNRPPDVLLTALANLQARHMREGHRLVEHLAEMTRRYPRMTAPFACPGAQHDLLYEAKYDHPEGNTTCSRCDSSRLMDREPRPSAHSVIHYGLIASGDQVMRHGATRDRLRKELDVLCFEMEAAGLMDSFPCLVIRGICDYADSHKNKRWQSYAAANAAAYAKDLLCLIPGNQVFGTQTAVEMTTAAEREIPLTEEERNCIRSLYLADYATKLDEIPAREPGTCEWALCHRNLREWADIGRSALLWLSGNPGCGKTVISSFLIESFRKSNDKVVYFICDNKHADFRTKESILGSLLHQLLVSNPILVRHATAHYKYKKESIATSAATLWTIFEDILRGEDIATVYCILDALDECEDETRKWILRKLSRLFSVRPDGRAHGSRHLKMVITSRPWEDIALGLSGASKIRLRTEDEANINHDIRLFVKKQVEPLAERRGYTTHQRETVIKTLVEKANGMFLWVSLIIDDLERTPICNIERRLQELPNTLHRLYEKILARVDLGAVERVKHILTWVVTAFRPLTVQELAIACELQQLHGLGHINIEDLVNYIKGDIGLCGPLLTIRTGYVNLVHQSAKDFLLQAQYRPGLYSSLSNYHINPAHSHAQLALLCIRYLSFDEFEISLLPINGLYKDYDLFEAHLDAFPFLKYAAINWPEHFRNSGECLLSSLESVKNFFGLSYKAAAWFQIFFFSNDDRFADCPSGGSSLHFATYIGILPIIELLIQDEEVEIDVEDDEGKTPLCWAIEYPLDLPEEKLGERSSVAQLILQAGANVKSQDYTVGATLLHWSVRYHKDQIAEQLIRAGANVNAQDYQMQTPLHWAAEDSYLGDRMADLLLKNGAYIDAIDDSGQTPLHVALEHDRDNVMILRLLEANASTHAMERNGMTPLLSALERSNYEAAELLLRKGADIKGKGPSGRSALHQAAEKGYEAVFMLLLEKGADIEAKDSFGLTALQRAAMNGHEAIVRQLLGRKGVNLGPINCLAIARLYRATESGNEVVVRQLLQEKGVDVEGRDSSGRTMLHRAAKNGHHKVVRLLLEKGANVEVKDSSGLTALSLAAENGYDAVVQLLLESGADVEARDRWGLTALHRAAGNGHEAVVRLLLSKGADVDAMNDNRRTALQKAAESGHKEVVQLLLEKGADIEAKDKSYGFTALFRATMNGHDVVVRLLLDQGANVIAMTNDGETALHRASQDGYAAVVRLLLEKGADVKGKDSSKRTALHHAAEKGHEAVVRLLLSKGADVEVKDPSGRTALHRAIENEHEAVVRLLLQTKESGATEESAETEENAEKRFPTLSRQHSVRQNPF